MPLVPPAAVALEIILPLKDYVTYLTNTSISE